MNVERLFAVAIAIRDDLARTSLILLLEQLAEALEALRADPGDVNYGRQVAEARDAVYRALETSEINRFSSGWRDMIATDLEIDHLIGNELKRQVSQILERNGVTLSEAVTGIKELSASVSNLSHAINNIIQAFEWLELAPEQLEDGEFEVGVFIPRSAVHEALAELGAEFRKLDRILGPFIEIGLDGSRPAIRVRSIASSNYQVYVGMVGVAAAAFTHAMSKLLGLYKQILDIREQRERMKKSGVPDSALAGVSSHVTGMMKEVIPVIAREVVDAYARGIEDEGRRNELINSLEMSLKELARRIDLGYNFEVREPEIAPPVGQNASDGEAVVTDGDYEYAEIVRERRAELEFIKPPGEPILEITDGDGGSESAPAEENGDGDAETSV